MLSRPKSVSMCSIGGNFLSAEGCGRGCGWYSGSKLSSSCPSGAFLRLRDFFFRLGLFSAGGGSDTLIPIGGSLLVTGIGVGSFSGPHLVLKKKKREIYYDIFVLMNLHPLSLGCCQKNFVFISCPVIRTRIEIRFFERIFCCYIGKRTGFHIKIWELFTRDEM